MLDNIKNLLRENRKEILKLSWVIFFCYSILMLWQVFIGPYRSSSGIRRYNLYPFKTIWNYFVNSEQYSFHILFINLAANIVTFIPLGFFMPLLFKGFNSTIIMAVFSAIITIVIESMQFVFNVGVFDIDDIILNTLGCIIGFALYKKVKLAMNKLEEF
ncbi:VanZ like family protein [Oxobacter pfennigii]|uniref:VanZ like family protein n=1 Tax=Oxobacter pfennigii TaxID=36849 RepID=A0A0P8YB34_9CLOT|nr:VanZ family protein [Oxobacter pfennigii]KPU44249.1 VanZ like family protein [Oxobacter pfennigii]